MQTAGPPRSKDSGSDSLHHRSPVLLHLLHRTCLCRTFAYAPQQCHTTSLLGYMPHTTFAIPAKWYVSLLPRSR